MIFITTRSAQSQWTHPNSINFYISPKPRLFQEAKGVCPSYIIPKRNLLVSPQCNTQRIFALCVHQTRHWCGDVGLWEFSWLRTIPQTLLNLVWHGWRHARALCMTRHVVPTIHIWHFLWEHQHRTHTNVGFVNAELSFQYIQTEWIGTKAPILRITFAYLSLCVKVSDSGRGVWALVQQQNRRAPRVYVWYMTTIATTTTIWRRFEVLWVVGS